MSSSRSTASRRSRRAQRRQERRRRPPSLEVSGSRGARLPTIAAYLRAAGAVGLAAALPKLELLAGYGRQLGNTAPSAERVLRAIVSAAPSYGIPIVSSNDGYFVAERPEDFDPCIADLTSRLEEIGARKHALEALQHKHRHGGLFS